MTREELIEKVAIEALYKNKHTSYREQATAAIALITEACAGIADERAERELEFSFQSNCACKEIAKAIRGLGKE